MTDETYRVLIVEDEPDINNLLAEVLAAYGLEVIQAFTGEDALRLIEKHRPDAVLLDLMLPGLSGYGICRQLKAARATRAIPVLILTALDRSEDRQQAYETGADDYLTKPFSPEGLVARLKDTIERSREAARPAAHVSMAFALEASVAGLKAVSALVTALYCQTALEGETVEALRSGLLRLAAAASDWAAGHTGAPPATLLFDLDGERAAFRFEPAGEDGVAFVNEHLQAQALVPSEFTDAGAIDRQTRDGQAVVMEKALPPQENAERGTRPATA